MSDQGQNNVVLAAGAFITIAVVIGGIWYFKNNPAEVVTDLVEDVTPSVDVTQAPETSAETPALAAQQAKAPEFDTFRVNPDGSMVVAGRAEPGQIIDIILAREAIERVTADASGSFVAFPVAEPSDRPRKLSLVADPDGAAVSSATSYIVDAFAAPAPPTVEPSQEEEQVAAAPAVTPAPEVVEPVVTPPPPPAAEPPAVLEADADGVRVVQAPELEPPENVALDAITYNPTGEVQLSGRASGEGEVQIYIDNTPVTTSPVLEGGDWRTDLPDVDTGVYTLRIDELDDEGQVVSRIETPFKREEAEDVAAALSDQTEEEGFEVAVKTVQPGATLWAIAQENFGDGIMYVAVFEANRDLIKDPDLIYPGQIFRIPETGQ